MFCALAEEYRNLTHQDKARYLHKGRLGTIAYRAGGKSFGVVSKVLALAVADRRLQHLAGRRAESQVALLPNGSAASALAIQTTQFPTELKRAQVDSKLFNVIVKKEHEAAASSLALWRSNEGMKARNDLVHRLPALASLSHGLTGEPCLAGVRVLCMTCPLADQVKRVMGLRGVAGFRTPLQSLNAEWGRLHQVTQHAQQENLPAEPKVDYRTKPSCLKAEFCLCGRRGTDVWSLKLWFCSAMKKSIPDPEYKKDLDNGFIVLRTTAFDDENAATFDDGDEAARGRFVTDIFVHICAMSRSPYRPTFRVMTWPGHKRDHLGRLELMATHSYETLLETLAHIVDHNVGSIALHAYALRDVAELLPELNPRWVLATRLRDATPQTKVLRQRRDHDPAHVVALCDQHRPGWGDALAAIGDAPGDDAEDFCDGVMTEHSDSHSDLGSHGVGSSFPVSAAWATTLLAMSATMRRTLARAKL